MLKSFFFKSDFFRACQNNFYIDYFIKKIIEIFVRNIFIYSAIFFGEKYIIEHFTKKIIEAYIFHLNQKTNFFIFHHSYFFTFNISMIFLIISIINIIILCF